MATAVEIGTAGENAVVSELKKKGFTNINHDTKGAGSTDIEAKGGSEHILVQVKSAVQPGTPSDLSSDEERNIKSRATNIGAVAWQAKVTLSSSLQVTGGIVWKKLS